MKEYVYNTFKGADAEADLVEEINNTIVAEVIKKVEEDLKEKGYEPILMACVGLVSKSYPGTTVKNWIFSEQTKSSHFVQALKGALHYVISPIFNSKEKK